MLGYKIYGLNNKANLSVCICSLVYSNIIAERAERSDAAEPICHFMHKLYMKFHLHLHTKRILKCAVLVSRFPKLFLR